MQNESELARLSTILVRGVTDSKLGTAILTQDRILFYDEKFSKTGTGGILEDLVVNTLQKRHEARGPMVEIALSSLTGLALQKKLLSRNRLSISTTDGDFLFSEGWKEWGPLLRDILTRHHDRRVTEQTPEVWRIEPN
jgi:hypothetical protein